MAAATPKPAAVLSPGGGGGGGASTATECDGAPSPRE